MMYIKKITISNIRCFAYVEIDLATDIGARMWAVIFGDNGVGKTTILRCIAVGLCDEASAAGLIRELYGEWVRVQRKNKPATIDIELVSHDRPSGVFRISTTIEPAPSGYSRVKQTTLPEVDFPWDDIFVCGYGAARRMFGTGTFNEYGAIDAVYTLFNYDAPLQNPELAIRRIDDAGISLRRIKNWVRQILVLPPGGFHLDEKGIQLKGPWGRLTPLGATGDGHQATLAWLLDFLGWALLYDPGIIKKDLRGIILIDEIEQHLHPKWQRQIIKLLHEQFPNVQFISTTHTPFCALGTTDLADDNCELITLQSDGKKSVATEDISPPRGKRVDQILTSSLFGISWIWDDNTRQQIVDYTTLMQLERRDRRQTEELQELRKELNKKLGSRESDFEEWVSHAVKKVLTDNVPDISDYPEDSIQYETLRQIREIMK